MARFEKDKTSQSISEHIITSIETRNDTFSVKKLGGSRKYHKYASFKITAVSYDVCLAILKMDWQPQKAEMFKNRDFSLPRYMEDNNDDNNDDNDNHYSPSDTRHHRGNNNNNNRGQSNQNQYGDGANRFLEIRIQDVNLMARI